LKKVDLLTSALVRQVTRNNQFSIKTWSFVLMLEIWIREQRKKN